MVMPNVAQPESLVANDPESLKRVRSSFATSGMNAPFVPELITEIIEEDVGPESDRNREETLRRIRTRSESVRKKSRAPVPPKQVLIDGLRSTAAAARSLEACLERLRDNAQVLSNRKQSLSSRLQHWFQRLMKRQPEAHVYELEFMDETTGTRHRESVNLEEFLEKLHKKARTYGGILSRNGALWSKISKANEDQLYKYMNQELGELQIIHRRAHAFDAFFKTQTTPNEKRKLRGIKIELTSIRNAISKANQLKHDYVRRKEEKEQLKKLGIRTE
jgi:hypothetical protein